MNAISGMAQLLSQKNFQKDEKEYIATIQKSSESLLSIINEILDFSKIDSGNMEILEDEYHFNSLIHDVLSIIEFRMRNKSVRLIIDIDPRIPRVLIGDQLRIRQVLINILNNAVNFTHRGHIRLHIIWQKNSEKDGCLEVEVEDTGIGISEESDAVVVIVSEETGNISVAYRGMLNTGFGEETLRMRIMELLNNSFSADASSDTKFSLKNIVKRGRKN